MLQDAIQEARIDTPLGLALEFVACDRGVVAPPYLDDAVDGELAGPTARALQGIYDAHALTPDAGWRDTPDRAAAVAKCDGWRRGRVRPSRR